MNSKRERVDRPGLPSYFDEYPVRPNDKRGVSFNDAKTSIFNGRNSRQAGPLVSEDEKSLAWLRQNPKKVATDVGIQRPLEQADNAFFEDKDLEDDFDHDEVRASPIQAVLNGSNPQDITVHLKLPVIDDIEAELEEFSILRRLGNFKAARSYFKEKLGNYRKVPYVFVQYAQMLLDAGDFKTLSKLRPEAVFQDKSLRGFGMMRSAPYQLHAC